MGVLWERGAATVAEVVEALQAPRLAYSTVLTTLRTLERKRYLDHRSLRRAYLFRPLVGPETAANDAAMYIVDRFFAKSAAELIVRLLNAASLNAMDIANIESALVRHPRFMKSRRSTLARNVEKTRSGS
jgi:predicted transcriptional regulator